MIIKRGGQTVAVVPVWRDLDAWFEENALAPAEHTVEYNDAERRQLIRTGIYSVADLPSLLGITADASAILLHVVAALAKAALTASDVSDFRDALAPFEPHLSAYADAIEAGTAKMPYLAKGGLSVVLPEIEAAGTAVAEVFETQA